MGAWILGAPLSPAPLILDLDTVPLVLDLVPLILDHVPCPLTPQGAAPSPPHTAHMITGQGAQAHGKLTTNTATYPRSAPCPLSR